MTRKFYISLIAAFLVAGCGGGGGGGGSSSGGGSGGGGTVTPPPTPTALYAVPAQEALTAADVQAILAQGISEAQGRARPATLPPLFRVHPVL